MGSDGDTGVTVRSGAASVPAAVLVERARSLAPMLRERALAAERDRRISDEVMAAIRSQGLLRILLPRPHGGFEHGFRVAYDVMRELGGGCASTAWVAGLAITHQWMLAAFPEETQNDVWATNPDALIFGSYPPSCVAETVAGGYRIKGKWPYASGCDNADWMLVGIYIPQPDGQKPAPGFGLLPRGFYGIEDDWHTAGLAATGSKSVVSDGIVVPGHRTVTFARLLTGQGEGARLYGGTLYRQPLLSIIPWVLATAAIGALQGAIEVFVDDTRGRTTRGAVVPGGKSMAGFAGVQSRLGEAKAALIAANGLAYRVLDRAAADEASSLDARIDSRLCQAYALRLVQQGIDALYGAVGGAGLQLDHPIQRGWRDIHAVAKHISMNWDAVSAMAGQHAFGLEPQGQY